MALLEHVTFDLCKMVSFSKADDDNPKSRIIESCSNDAMQDWISSDVDIISNANFPDTI